MEMKFQLAYKEMHLKLQKDRKFVDSLIQTERVNMDTNVL